MHFLREIAQGIAQGKTFLLLIKYVLALRRMVDCSVVWLQFRQRLRYSSTYLFCKFFFSHSIFD